MVPVFPPYGSGALRAGALPGEPGAPTATATATPPALSSRSPLATPDFFRKFDVEGDGQISFAEFIFFVTLLAIPRGEICAAFKMFDADGSGSLDRAEFRAMFRVLRAQSRQGAAAAGRARTGFGGAGGADDEALDDACCSAFFFGKDGRGKLTLPKFEAFMNVRLGARATVWVPPESQPQAGLIPGPAGRPALRRARARAARAPRTALTR